MTFTVTGNYTRVINVKPQLEGVFFFFQLCLLKLWKSVIFLAVFEICQSVLGAYSGKRHGSACCKYQYIFHHGKVFITDEIVLLVY